jgi:hypothetical protein
MIHAVGSLAGADGWSITNVAAFIIFPAWLGFSAALLPGFSTMNVHNCCKQVLQWPLGVRSSGLHQ